MTVRELAHRVDALVVAYRVEFSEPRLAELAARQAVAQEHGRAELDLADADADGRGGWRFELKRTRSIGRHYFENGDVRCVIDFQAPAPIAAPQRRSSLAGGEDFGAELDAGGSALVPPSVGWTLEVTARASWLAVTDLREAIAAMRAIAATFGHVHGERLRRFDACGDFAGWRLRPSDADAFVKPRRAKIGSFLPDIAHERSDELDELDELDEGARAARVYRDKRGTVTGFVIGAGGALLMRLYDKRAELRLPQSEHKAEFEHAIWKLAGWNEPADELDELDDDRHVSRLEFQVRAEALDEMKLRNPDDLPGKLDAVWAYCVRRWVRLVDPDTASRLSRCELDERWTAATAVIFYHRAAPIKRERRRGAATLAQALGSILSLLGQVGRLDATAGLLRRWGTEKEIAARIPFESRAGALDELVGELTDSFRALAVAELSKGQRAAPFERLVVSVRAAAARFAPLPNTTGRNLTAR